MTNTPETLNILDPDFRMPEHCGGDRWSILHGDSLQILRVVPFTEIWYYVALVFLGAGILVGVGGSLTAIRRFLRV